jgi:hypothetical protein
MKEEGLQKTAQTAMLVNKQSLSQEERSPQGEKAKNGSPPQDNKRVASLLFKSYSGCRVAECCVEGTSHNQ